MAWEIIGTGHLKGGNPGDNDICIDSDEGSVHTNPASEEPQDYWLRMGE